MGRKLRIIWGILVLCLSFCAGLGDCPAQPASQEAQEPAAKLGEIDVRIKKFESAPSPLRMVEVHVQVLNQSGRDTFPARSVRVRVTPKEIVYAEPVQPGKTLPPPEEITLPSQILPGTGQFIFVGFALDGGNPESATFEIQINPPQGDQRTVSKKF